NPVCCAAGRAVLGQLRDGKLARAAAELGARLSDDLRSYARSGRPGAAYVGDVRGRGLALGVELVDPLTREPDAKLTAKAVYRGWHLGVVAYPVRDNVIELTPALTITAPELDRAVELLTRAIDDAASGYVTDEEIAHYTGW
ncbi:MAG: aminotransferase class III-fold pyridoxal phosphate-dependent enzyme, partial [Micrococcales bacterium]|nr:aminotransferase class III-fold pyridoxal phosphate-dependent enzyme [Micrococcales bacterium]